MSLPIRLTRTANAIRQCWKVAETATCDSVQSKYWAPAEENITFLFSCELRQSIIAANGRGEFGRAFVQDLQTAYPELRLSTSIPPVLNTLLGSVSFHGHWHEGKISGADLGLIIRRPSVLPSYNHLTIRSDYARALLVQAKVGRPDRSKPTRIHWDSLTQKQRSLIPTLSSYYSLLLYRWRDSYGRGLCPFRWQNCQDHEVSDIAEWLRDGSFPDESDSDRVVLDLAIGKLGTDKPEVITSIVNPPKGANPVLEIRIGWRPGDVPPSGLKVILPQRAKQSQQLTARIRQ